MWCLSHPITWCLFRIRHVTAGGSVPFDPEMATDPRVCKFDKFGGREEIWNQKHLPLSWDCWNESFYESCFLPLLSTELTVDTRLDPSIFINIRILGSSVHDSLVFQRFHVNLSSHLQRRRHFDLSCITCVYDCAGPMEKTQARCSSCPCDSPPPSCY